MEAVLDVERRVGVEVSGRPAGAREVVSQGLEVRRDADRRAGGVLLGCRYHSGQQRGDRGGRPRRRCPGALGLPGVGEDAIEMRRRRSPAAVEPDRVAARGVEEEDDQGVVLRAGLHDPQIRDHDAGGRVGDEGEGGGGVGGDRHVLVGEPGSRVENALDRRQLRTRRRTGDLDGQRHRPRRLGRPGEAQTPGRGSRERPGERFAGRNEDAFVAHPRRFDEGGTGSAGSGGSGGFRRRRGAECLGGRPAIAAGGQGEGGDEPGGRADRSRREWAAAQCSGAQLSRGHRSRSARRG